MKSKFLTTSVLLAAVVFLSALIGEAQTSSCAPLAQGCLDNTFGTNGISVYSIPNASSSASPTETVIQSDGKILSLMDTHSPESTSLGFTNVIIRYNADGTLDTGFGNGGFVYMNWNNAANLWGTAYAMAVQRVQRTDESGNLVTDERIVVGGAYNVTGACCQYRVDRYLPDGNPDLSFGASGNVIMSNAWYPYAIAIQPADQKILTVSDGSTASFVRLNVDGTKDATFGNNGIADAPGFSHRSLAIQSNGKIIVAGYYRKGGGTSDFAVGRFNANGTPDSTFGTSGKVITDFARGSDTVQDVAVISGDYIIAVGIAEGKYTGRDMAVIRYKPNGQLDTTFGVSGKKTFDFNGDDTAARVGFQSNGKIVLFGHSTGVGGDTDLAVVRLTANGAIDSSFGQGGKTALDFFGGKDLAAGAIQLDPNCSGCEKLVIAGIARNGAAGNYCAIAARFIP